MITFVPPGFDFLLHQTLQQIPGIAALEVGDCRSRFLRLSPGVYGYEEMIYFKLRARVGGKRSYANALMATMAASQGGKFYGSLAALKRVGPMSGEHLKMTLAFPHTVETKVALQERPPR